MPVFAHLEIEPDVQINDRTRLNVAKSFVTKGATALSALTVTPGVGVTGIDVMDAIADNRYLDWEFNSWTMDIDATNNKLEFSEGNTDFEATLSSGTYSLAALATEIATQMDAVGTGTYTVAYNSDDKITISSTVSFALLPVGGDDKATSILPHIGFPKDTAPSSSVTGRRTEYVIKKVTLSVTNGTLTDAESKYIKVYSVDGDKLFSSDGDLIRHESDILKWTYGGRNTFKDIHRRAQQRIIKFLDEQGYVDIYDEKFTKDAFIDLDEVRDWSAFMVLKIIFQGLSNEKDDVFRAKSSEYEKMEAIASQRAILRIDTDGDGKVQPNEGLRITSGTLWQR